MNRQTSAATATWVPLAAVHWLDARGKTARTRDGQLGIIVEFVGRSAVLSISGKRATVPTGECEIMQVKG